MDGVSVEFSDADGRIAVRSAAVGQGYSPEEDADVLGGGVFRPADLVKKTASGLTLIGRTSDFINVGGRKLNPFEVERRLAEFPGVRHVTVFGVESRVPGEDPVACVVGQIDHAALLRHAASILPAWQVPKDVWVLDETPVSDRGKISRRQLAERYVARALPASDV
jgi:acyl-CoA synthetase (AMP-forming)/AMP-acid ligase II